MRKDAQMFFYETLDMNDIETFQLVMSLNEEEQGNAVISIGNRLYKMIVNKLEDIDFKEIEKSKGDITKFSQYKRTKDCIDVLMTIANQSKNGVEEVSTLNEALKNLEKHKDLFIDGFKTNTSIVKYFYDTIVMALISDIGFFTTVCVEFIKNPDSTVSLEIKNLQEYKSRFYLIHKNLERFNKACAKGEIEKGFRPLINNKSKHEAIGIFAAVPIIIAAAITIVYTIIPILRDLTYLFFKFRSHLSDWFTLQKELLEANAARLKSIKSVDGKDNKTVIASQEKWANRMAKIADFLAIKYVPAEKEVIKQVAKDSTTTISKRDVVEPPDSDDGPSLF